MLKRLSTAIILSLGHLLAFCQGFAGPDRSICGSGSVQIGTAANCSGCCYKWSPAAGLDDPSKPNPIVSGIAVSTNYAVTVSYPDGNYIEDDVNITVYESDLQVYHPDYHEPNTLLPESDEKVPGVQSYQLGAKTRKKQNNPC